MNSSLRAFLYVSEMAPDLNPAEVSRILTVARHQNGVHGETGVLVFDGQSFCQYFEGEWEPVSRLASNLLRDARHIRMRVLADRPITARVYQQFLMGYAELEDSERIRSLAQLDSRDLLEKFHDLASSFDITA